ATGWAERRVGGVSGASREAATASREVRKEVGWRRLAKRDSLSRGGATIRRRSRRHNQPGRFGQGRGMGNRFTSVEAAIDQAAHGVLARMPRGRLTDGLIEFLVFGLKQAWACLFGGLMLGIILATRLWWPEIEIGRAHV